MKSKLTDPNLIATRQSWNQATRIHNLRKGDQAAFLRDGGELLFPEECELLGDVQGKDLVHLQCNSGQDSLCLAARGAQVTGVDFSDEAIRFARQLSSDAGLPATFIQAEVVDWMHTTPHRCDVAFASYGALPWIEDLGRWFAGVHRILRPGGKLVCMEFHPLVWSFGPDLRPTQDDYFAHGPFVEPVSDYVGDSGASLQSENEVVATNTLPASSWQCTLAETVTLVLKSGLSLTRVDEYPFANGCRVHEKLEAASGRRWVWPEGLARLPLMYSLVALRV